MRPIAALLLVPFVLAAQPVAAQEIGYASVEVEEAPDEVVTVAGDDADADEGTARVVEVAAQPAAVQPGIAAYGPFRVLDGGHAALVDVTDAATPAAFAAMLGDYPEIGTIEMVTCPGTEDDQANLALGRMIRARGLATHVPDGGFVGSGAVELFLAGLHRYAEPSAQFAVHSWEDADGHEANDFSPDAPQNRAYVDYYEAVGMTAAEARAFCAMTNSVPFASAKWLSRAELAQWVRLDSAFPVLDLIGPLQ
jgi:hypothetical protein